jgi:uncharacterized membrane protein
MKILIRFGTRRAEISPRHRPYLFFKKGEKRVKAIAFGVFFTFVLAGTAALAQMGGGQGMGQGGMNHTNGWMGGGMWIWTVIGVLVVVLLVVLINKVSKK